MYLIGNFLYKYSNHLLPKEFNDYFKPRTGVHPGASIPPETVLLKNLGVLRRIAYLLPSKILVNLYYTLINPYLLFGNIEWASNYHSRIICLFLLQKRDVRIIARDGYLAHTSLRFLEFGIMKFGNINTYLIGNFLYKYSNHLLPKEFSDYFNLRTEVHNHFTRFSDGLSVQFARTNYRKFHNTL